MERPEINPDSYILGQSFLKSCTYYSGTPTMLSKNIFFLKGQIQYCLASKKKKKTILSVHPRKSD